MPPLGVGRVPYIGAPGCPILPSLHIAPGALWGVSVSHRCVPPVGCPISAASSCWSLVRLAAGLQYGLVVGGSGSRLGVVVGVLGLPGSGMGLGWSGQVPAWLGLLACALSVPLHRCWGAAGALPPAPSPWWGSSTGGSGCTGASVSRGPLGVGFGPVTGGG